VTETLCIPLYVARQIQATEKDDYKRRIYFCNWFLKALHDSGFDPKYKFSIEEACFHLSGFISVQSFKARVYRPDPHTAEDLKGSILSFLRLLLCECKHLWSCQECVLIKGKHVQHLLLMFLSLTYLYMGAQTNSKSWVQT
jgi:hypothetical protein